MDNYTRVVAQGGSGDTRSWLNVALVAMEDL